jgi:Uma2 family endonuclease
MSTSSGAQRLLTAQEYLELERKAPFKSEFIAGKMYAMSGASLQHNRIVTNLVLALGARLKGRGCNIYAHDLRVKLPAGDAYAYPDLVIVCEKERLGDDQCDTLLNPQLIVEVLSPGTEAYDRGAKFQHYQQIGSLQEYVLVSQAQALVESFQRQTGAQWLFTSFAGVTAVAEFPSLDCSIPLAEAY